MRHTWHGVDDLLLAGRARYRTNQAGCGSTVVMDERGTDWPIGLTVVRFWHRAATSSEHRSDLRLHLGHPFECGSHHFCETFPGDVVLSGAESATADHRVGSTKCVDERPNDPCPIVTDLGLHQAVDPCRGKLLTDPRRVCVDDLPEEQLGSDSHNFTTHTPMIAAADTHSDRSPRRHP